METTVTGLFSDADAAQRARQELEREGFGHGEITVLNKETDHLHELLGEETSDAERGAILGAVVGGIGAAIGAITLCLPPLEVFDAHWAIAALVGAGIGGVASAGIGFLVGSATGHQVQEEYEHCIEQGGQVIAINTDRAHAAKAYNMLERFGGQGLSTAVHHKHHAKETA